MPVQHVVVVTYGEPQSASFVDQLTYSWRILLGLTRTVAPIPQPLLPIIALSRARMRNRAWTGEGYTSPLEAITVRQARNLQAALTALDPSEEWRVQVAYEFRRPLLDDMLATIPADEPAVVVPMYATDSDFTHGLSRRVVRDIAYRRSLHAAVRVLPAFHPDWLGDISAAHILETLQPHPEWIGENVALVLAAHGTLLAPSRPIDTGLHVTEQLCAAIRTRLSSQFGLVVNGWLNHTRGGRWTDPPIDLALRQVAGAGFTRVVYYPYGFLADNAETELEGRVALRAQPGLAARHLPCLNDSPLLIDALARHVAGQDSGRDARLQPPASRTSGLAPEAPVHLTGR